MTTIPTDHSPETPTMLPQYGFGTDVDFQSLVKANNFLFRVYTPKAPSPFSDDSEPSFVAPKFNERYSLSPEEFKQGCPSLTDNQVHVGTYDDVAIHMDWTTRSYSPYISTSFSFIWSIWEALRRYHIGVKKDVQIAIIDASAVSRRSVTAVQLLRNSLPSKRRAEHWKWYRFAQESQSVLVHEYIPAHAVLSSIPLILLLEKLPSYFLRPEINDTIKGDILSTVGWDYTEKKRSYRQFCQDMSNRFLQSSPEAKLQDTTTGSVRLAISFLRPWFHKCVIEDYPTSVETLCSFAFSIANWPGQWWAREHPDILDLIRVIILSLAEEIRATHRQDHSSDEISRLHEVVNGLEDVIKRYEDEVAAKHTRKPLRLLTPLIIPQGIRPAIMPASPSPFTLAPSSSISTQCRKAVPTPITPPTSPIRLTAPAFPSVALSPTPQLTPILALTIPSTSAINPRFVPCLHVEDEYSTTPTESLTPSGDDLSVCSFSLTELPLLHEEAPIDHPTPISPPSDSPEMPELFSLEESPQREPPLQLMNELPPVASSLHHTEPSSVPEVPKDRRVVHRRPPSIAETASCLVTGFLVGAFITLCILSPQRRTLLHVT